MFGIGSRCRCVFVILTLSMVMRLGFSIYIFFRIIGI